MAGGDRMASAGETVPGVRDEEAVRHMPDATQRPPAGGPERVPFVRPDLPDFEALRPHLEAIVASGQLTKGSYLRRFEEAVAEHLGVRHAVGVSSCTVGLVLLHQALARHAGRCPDRGCPVGRLRGRRPAARW